MARRLPRHRTEDLEVVARYRRAARDRSGDAHVGAHGVEIAANGAFGRDAAAGEMRGAVDGGGQVDPFAGKKDFARARGGERHGAAGAVGVSAEIEGFMALLGRRRAERQKDGEGDRGESADHAGLLG